MYAVFVIHIVQLFGELTFRFKTNLGHQNKPSYNQPRNKLLTETLFSNRVTSGNKRFDTPPLSRPFKVGVFVVFYG